MSDKKVEKVEKVEEVKEVKEEKTVKKVEKTFRDCLKNGDKLLKEVPVGNNERIIHLYNSTKNSIFVSILKFIYICFVGDFDKKEKEFQDYQKEMMLEYGECCLEPSDSNTVSVVKPPVPVKDMDESRYVKWYDGLSFDEKLEIYTIGLKENSLDTHTPENIVDLMTALRFKKESSISPRPLKKVVVPLRRSISPFSSFSGSEEFIHVSPISLLNNRKKAASPKPTSSFSTSKPGKWLEQLPELIDGKPYNKVNVETYYAVMDKPRQLCIACILDINSCKYTDSNTFHEKQIYSGSRDEKVRPSNFPDWNDPSTGTFENPYICTDFIETKILFSYVNLPGNMYAENFFLVRYMVGKKLKNSWYIIVEY